MSTSDVQSKNSVSTMLQFETYNSPFLDLIFVSSLICAIITILISLFIIGNISIQYYRLFYVQKCEQSRTAYILVILYCIFIIITTIAFGRLNLSSIQRASTIDRCIIGYYIFYVFGYLSMSFVHAIYIWRIERAFCGSVYAYHPYIYRCLYTLTILIFIIWSAINIWDAAPIDTIWIVRQSNHFPISDCVLGDESISYNVLPMVMTAGIVHMVVNTSLMYMFNRGLWLLNKRMIQLYQEEQIQLQNMDSHSVVGNSPSLSPTNPNPDNVVPDLALPRQGSAVRDLKNVIDVYKKKGEKADQLVKEVVRKYNMIKKYTILVSISIVSAMIFLICMAINTNFLYECSWYFLVNIVCLWMMLSTSKRYWMCCRDYGLCRCCYVNTGKVNSK